MGQYHVIYNVTKHESINIGGAKLWEQAHSATAAALLLLLSNSNGRGGGDFNTYPADYNKPTPQELADKAIIDRVSGRWAGDALVVQGDYATETDTAYVPTNSKFKDITCLVCDALLIADNGDNSEIVEVIVAEGAHSSAVELTKRADRNNQVVPMYQAAGATPKRRTKRGAK